MVLHCVWFAVRYAFPVLQCVLFSSYDVFCAAVCLWCALYCNVSGVRVFLVCDMTGFVMRYVPLMRLGLRVLV